MKKLTAVIATAFIAASLFASGGREDSKVKSQIVKIGVTGAMYDDIWAPAIESLKKEGIQIQLVQFSDYVQPSRALEDGEVDLHACLSRAFFESEVKSHDYHIQRIANTLYVPLKLYSVKIKSASELKAGDIIAIPNEATNEGRALKLLASGGVIKLKEGAGFNPKLDDIVSIPSGAVLKQFASNTIPSTLIDVTAAIINGGYALDFGIDPDTAIVSETKPDTAYWNLIAARTADLSDKKKVALYDKVVKAFQVEATKKVFDEKFNGYFQQVGWDIDELKEYK